MTVLETAKNHWYGNFIVLSQLLLLIAGFGHLNIKNQITSYLFIAAILVTLVLFIKLIREYFIEFLSFILILAISLSPILVYGKSHEGILFFGSAYSVDFQQYLSVAFSLSNEGLPLQNPYWPGIPGFYHYGYLLPFASLLTVVEQERGSFFLYSYSFLLYSAATTLLLLFAIRLFFFKSFRSALLAICVGLFACSYKAIYAISLVFVAGSELSGYDTPVGFKTLQNDVMFGPHYLYSGVFLLYFLHVLSKSLKGELSTTEIATLMLISFLAPLINGFSPVILASLVGGYLIAKHLKTPFGVLTDKDAWVLLVCLVTSYLAIHSLNVFAPGLRQPTLDISLYSLFNLCFGLLVNFGVLVILFLFAKDRKTPLYKISLISIILLTVIIAVLGIDGDLESKFSISRRIGSVILLILVVNVSINRFRWSSVAIMLPATLTFFGQNYYFFNSQQYVDRTVGISSELFNLQGAYNLDKEAYELTDKYRFNFDLITGKAAIRYPNSKGFHQYSPKQYTSEYSEKGEEHVVTISFKDNAFIPVEAPPMKN